MSRATTTLGCDVSTERIALADSTGRTASIDLPQLDKGAARLAEAHKRTATFTREFVGRRQIVAAFVERPGGRVHPSLWQMLGVTLSAISGSLADRYAHPVSVWLIPVSQWKELSVGKGSATKEDIVRWCASESLAASNQDEYDALGIARAGQAMLEKGTR